MKCYICDKTLDDEQVSFNEDYQSFDPCATCLMAVEDILDGYGDRPTVEAEDDFDPVLEGLFPPISDPFGVEDFS